MPRADNYSPCNRFDLFCEVPNSGAATSRDLIICLMVIELGLQNSSRPLGALPPTFSTYSQTIQIKANDCDGITSARMQMTIT